MIDSLIVDDESLARKGLRIILPWEKHGIRIIGEAANGEKALEFIREHPVQLVITDITMPVMSGLELMRQLHIVNPAIKVVVVTCHQDFEFIQDALRLGAIDYIVKTQLEDQDLDEVLRRISKRLHTQLAEQTVGKPAPGEADDERKIERIWNSISWVVDDLEYRMMTDSLNEEKYNNDYPKVRECLLFWQRCLIQYPSWSSQAEKLDDRSVSMKVWLEETRKGIQRWLRQSTCSEEMIQAVVRSLDIIHHSPVEEISQTEICRKVNISKSYFSKVFKDILGVSFIFYIQQVFVDAAKDLLKTTNYPVYWIADHCGFSDTRYFSKIFREHTGMLPSEYRQQP